MSFLTGEQVGHYLQQIRELGAASRITDMHVHATEVIRGRKQYVGDPADLLSEPGSPDYQIPRITPLRLIVPDAASRMPAETRNRLSEGMFERSYRHTGNRVMHDQMDLCGVRHALMLPVATAASSIEEQMAILMAMQNASGRILIGYSVPAEVPTASVEAHLRKAVSRFPIVAVKLHPNLSAINLGTDPGKARVEAILESCGKLQLPVIVHGGCSPILGDSPQATFSTIDELSRIDWSVTGSDVIIAHFGVYGCHGHGSQSASFATVNRLLDRYPNLYLDTSGVGPEVMLAALESTDLERLVFGSDALYIPMWQVLVSIVHALRELRVPNGDDMLERIAVQNAAKILDRQAVKRDGES
jgi:predicted TIM-barrel fold metal-dependent hydrolase